MEKMFFRVENNFWIGAFPTEISCKTNKNSFFLALKMLNKKSFIYSDYTKEEIEIAEKTFKFISKHKFLNNLAFFSNNPDALLRYLVEVSGSNTEKQEYIKQISEFYLWVT